MENYINDPCRPSISSKTSRAATNGRLQQQQLAQQANGRRTEKGEEEGEYGRGTVGEGYCRYMVLLDTGSVLGDSLAVGRLYGVDGQRKKYGRATVDGGTVGMFSGGIL